MGKKCLVYDVPTHVAEARFAKQFERAVARVVQYLYGNEADHYDACKPADRKDHIFLAVATLNAWLNEQPGWINEPVEDFRRHLETVGR